jgi:phosphoglycolate phosphatase
VLIGDTPKDVDAGLSAGVHVIGVATGSTTLSELRAAGAHDAVADLRACLQALRALLGRNEEGYRVVYEH